jgi:protein TonB
MFEEFDQGSGRKSRRQLAASLGVSFVVYTSLLGGVVAASAAYKKIAQKEDLVQVELRPPPKAEPPKPPPPPPEAKPAAPNKPVVNARAKVIRPELKTPDEIPDEKPEEADGPLPDAPTGDEGKDGFLDGVVGGTGTASASEATYAPPPPAPPKKPSAPVPSASNATPEYPRAARRAGIAGVVKVRIWITETGSVSKVEILEGDPIFHSAVTEALMTWRYQPARLPDGSAVAVKRVIHIPFQIQ